MSSKIKNFILTITLVICLAIILLHLKYRTVSHEKVHIFRDTVQITWIYDEDSLKEELGNEAHGRAYIGEDCIIYAPAPKDEFDTFALETLGHEAFHCFAGQFHR